MSIQQLDQAYAIYTQVRAEITNQSEAEIEAALPSDQFERQVRDLHYPWVCGEFFFGRFTELIGVPHWELWEILDALGLPRHK